MERGGRKIEEKNKEMSVLVIHGPNLNMLGRREPDIYGKLTLNKINNALKKLAQSLKVGVRVVQFNDEGTIINSIHHAEEDAILINPAAYTHTSVAIRDAISAAKKLALEVHLSNIYSREEFRHKSLIAPVCIGQISGLGLNSYLLGLRALVDFLKEKGYSVDLFPKNTEK